MLGHWTAARAVTRRRFSLPSAQQPCATCRRGDLRAEIDHPQCVARRRSPHTTYVGCCRPPGLKSLRVVFLRLLLQVVRAEVPRCLRAFSSWAASTSVLPCVLSSAALPELLEPLRWRGCRRPDVQNALDACYFTSSGLGRRNPKPETLNPLEAPKVPVPPQLPRGGL